MEINPVCQDMDGLEALLETANSQCTTVQQDDQHEQSGSHSEKDLEKCLQESLEKVLPGKHETNANER